MYKLKEIYDKFIDVAWNHAPKFVQAALILIIGFWLVKKIIKMLDFALSKQNIGKEVRPYLRSITGIGLKIGIIIWAISILGVETTSLTAVLAAAGFAIGLAWQGSLGNFAAGIMILAFRPYRVKDIVEIDGEKGEVKEIQIFNTILQTITNETVIIPNGMAMNNKLVNHSSVGNIRVDVYTHIPYNQNFSQVEKILLEAIAKNKKILPKPTPAVTIDSYDSHSIKIGVFVFAKPYHYWDVYYAVTKMIKTEFGKHSIKIAYSEGVELGEIGQEA